MAWEQEWMPLRRLSKTWRTNSVGQRHEERPLRKAQIKKIVAEFTVLKRAVASGATSQGDSSRVRVPEPRCYNGRMQRAFGISTKT
uniref:Uncharacterized protein n=1 Tax=Nymphaea colorata TaxID=210225 RepID=A0A5K0W3E5_9MAGN